MLNYVYLSICTEKLIYLALTKADTQEDGHIRRGEDGIRNRDGAGGRGEGRGNGGSCPCVCVDTAISPTRESLSLKWKQWKKREKNRLRHLSLCWPLFFSPRLPPGCEMCLTHYQRDGARTGRRRGDLGLAFAPSAPTFVCTFHSHVRSFVAQPRSTMATFFRQCLSRGETHSHNARYVIQTLAKSPPVAIVPRRDFILTRVAEVVLLRRQY